MPPASAPRRRPPALELTAARRLSPTARSCTSPPPAPRPRRRPSAFSHAPPPIGFLPRAAGVPAPPRLYTEEYYLNEMQSEGIPEMQRSNFVSCIVQEGLQRDSDAALD